MAPISLEDIRLSDYTLDTLPRLKQLRQRLLGEPARICIERAQWITRYYRNGDNPQEPTEIRYAKAVNHFLNQKAPRFFDDNLLAGSTTSKPFGAPVYPEYTGLHIWPELDTISERTRNPQILSKEDAETLNFEIYPYWMERNVLEYTRKKHNNPPCMRLFERIVFFLATKAGCISHTVPDYRLALHQGLAHIMETAATKADRIRAQNSRSPQNQQQLEFYEAAQIAMAGVIHYARNLSREARRLADIENDPDRKANLEAMARVCGRVPEKPARTFREAVNALWIIQVAIHGENINMAMSPGRLDQILFPFYQADRAAGRLTVQEALELVGSLWLKLNDNTNLVPETAEELFGGAGTVPAVTVGGVNAQGDDAVNDLTYIMLRVTELLKTRDPSLNARFHYEVNSQTYRDRVAEVIVNTRAVPAVHNDVADIQTLENQGVTTEDARDYAVIGCVELASAGRSYDASSAIMLNLVSVLELTLYNGKRPVTGDEQIGPQTGDPAQFTSFEAFWEAFKSQLRWLAGQAIQLNEYFGRAHQEILPSPLLSSFFSGPLETGKDLIFGGARYNSSGATHIGFADTVDSLSAIEKAVFVDRKCTFTELIQALKTDFKENKRLQAYLTRQTPKYGTDAPIAKKNSQNLIRFLFEFYQGHTTYRGGKYRPGYWTMTNHAGHGKLSGALPNGRRANRVFASGITPVSQATPDLAACLRSVARLEGRCIPSGEALNLKYPAISNESDLRCFAQAIEAYLRYGGLHIQYNIMSYETLIEAKAHPDRYPELLVRVSGYSAYFNDLNEAMKDEIITRTAYDIKTGRIIPFPEQHSDMLSNTDQ
ncbi:MAG: pyruvate formate lyase family protein [Desulfobacterales bacterium]